MKKPKKTLEEKIAAILPDYKNLASYKLRNTPAGCKYFQFSDVLEPDAITKVEQIDEYGNVMADEQGNIIYQEEWKRLRLFLILTPRQVGKTTDMWGRIIENFLKHDRPSVLVRRREEEIKNLKTKLPGSVLFDINIKFKLGLIVKGETIFDTFSQKIVVFLHALSTAANHFSVAFSAESAPIADVYFDEAQQHGGKPYLKNEFDSFRQFMAHIQGNFATDCNFWLFGNTLTVDNPYVEAFQCYDPNKKITYLSTYGKMQVFTDKDFILLPEGAEIPLWRKLAAEDPQARKMMLEGQFSRDNTRLILFRAQILSKLPRFESQFHYHQTIIHIYKLNDGSYWLQESPYPKEGAPLACFNYEAARMYGQAVVSNMEYTAKWLHRHLNENKIFFSNNEARETTFVLIRVSEFMRDKMKTV